MMLHTWSVHYCINMSVHIVKWCCTPGQHTTVSTCQSVFSHDVAHLVNTLLCQHVSLFHHMMLHIWSTHYCVNMLVCFLTWHCTPGQHTTVSTCQSILSHDVAHLVNTLLCQHVSFITRCCTPGQHTTVSTCQSVLSHDGVHLVNMSVCNVTWYCTAGLVNSQTPQFTNKDYTLSKLPRLPTNTVPCQSWTTSGDTLHPQKQYLVKVGSVSCGNTLQPQTQYLVTQYHIKVGVHQVVTHFTHKHSTLSKLECIKSLQLLLSVTGAFWWVFLPPMLKMTRGDDFCCSCCSADTVPLDLILEPISCTHVRIEFRHTSHTYHSCSLTTLWMRTNR